MRRPRRDRWLSMAEVADLLKLKHRDRRRRREAVQRLLARLEERDGTRYLRRFGPGRGKLWVSIAALEQLMPWDPGTLTAIRGDVDAHGTRITRLERRVDRHQIDIVKLREASKKAAEALTLLAGV